MITRTGNTEKEEINISNMNGKDVALIILRRLVHEGEYNRGEDILFEELEKDSSIDMYKVGVEFYDLLDEKSDEELSSGGFSRSEIEQGRRDIKRYIV